MALMQKSYPCHLPKAYWHLRAKTRQVRALLGLPGGGVPATYLSSQQSVAERRAVLAELGKATPTAKLLYVTPEQLVRSGALIDTLTALHARGCLARVVVDEVCT